MGKGVVNGLSTLKDIAELVGVSVSTVSRVINNDTSRHVNPDTKIKVWNAARELGYEPNESARRLVRNQKEGPIMSKKIGCIVASTQLRDDHPYFSPILTGLNRKLVESGYSLAFIHTPEEVNTEMVLHQMIHNHYIDGLVIIGDEMDQALLDYIKATSLAVVGISASGSGIPLVDYDRISAAKAAVHHLIAQGHRKIGFVGGQGHTGELKSEERYQGYEFALYEAGIPLDPTWIINTRWQVDKSYECMTDLLEKHQGEAPTAMFAASDLLAIPAMRAVIECNLRIPEDIAFIAMDNIDLAQYTSPPLSSVHVPKAEIGMVAAKALLDQLQGESILTTKILLPHEMILRQSSIFSRAGSPRP